MRKIKFRVWDKKEKRILPLGEDDKEYVMVLNSGEVLENGEGVFYPTENNLVLMQFTGLLDRHGKEIYEGDIVKYWQSIGGEKIMPIEWDKEGSWWPRPYEDDYISLSDFEVIGNIYENPKLIKK